MNLTNLVLSQWLYERYVVGGIIGTAAFSLILLAGRITDSVSDPFIAFWTDNSWTRWGRRMPFLVLATLPLAAVCFFLWWPPEHASHSVRIFYAACMCQFYFLLYGLVVTPYLALLPEISSSRSGTTESDDGPRFRDARRHNAVRAFGHDHSEIRLSSARAHADNRRSAFFLPIDRCHF